MKQTSPYYLHTNSAPEARHRAYDEVPGSCPRCGGLSVVEVNTNGRGKLVEVRRLCRTCRIAGLLRKHQAG